MKPIKALGIATMLNEKVLDVFYFQMSESDQSKNSITRLDEDACSKLSHLEDLKIAENKEVIEVNLVEDVKIEDVPTAFLKLHLISLKQFKPNELNLDNIFNVLETLAWTSKGPMTVKDAQKELLVSKANGSDFKINSIDKFPPLTDYILPEKVRIADTARIRLGAYLGEGTTIMHAGFVNFNAGTEGPNMIEGRVSSKVFLSKGSDLGGGASTMGTLSGGNDQVVSIGENSLVGANSGVGISLGANCTVEAGLYITAGTKVTLLDDENNELKTIKALELSGVSNMLYLRDSVSGKVIGKSNNTNFSLNEILHVNN